MNVVADKLREARALIERGWCRQAFARDSDGDKVPTCSPNAARFCAMGALSRADAWQGPVTKFLREATDSPTVAHIMDWNDAPERTQDEVLAAFDKAIALAEQEQAQ